MEAKRVNILGVNFYHSTMASLLNTLTERILQKKKTFVVTANPEIVMVAKNDAEYKNAIDLADYVIPDGIGVVKASVLLNQPLPERVAGFDLMIHLLEVANQHKLKIYLLGSKEDVLPKTINTITKNYPEAKIVGYHHGFFDGKEEEIKQQIIDSEPDLIFVALGVPKQELWISINIGGIKSGLFMGVGGSFDVLAGEVKRAPEIWQRLNLEWFYRLAKQPWRLKRMLVLPVFVVKVMEQKFKIKKY
ncbi:WecB/TagA/CpsF family glycosyltransferase [Fredinandcohnia onubensis]|uniref:WecB/TagA/CpsF family glycosyltransferase n=1 Tax=Fredinandcohnia onubensis TaxID=1571209 RepID=UPI000C0BD239|nr:WecB/TagA/CpsF family glycosyltransferase [Fredinandcohnia onubensis]